MLTPWAIDVRHFEYFQEDECLSNAHCMAGPMASAFWWPRRNQEVGLLCSLFCVAMSDEVVNSLVIMFAMLLWVCIHTRQAEKFAWPRWESKPRPSGYYSNALPTEIRGQVGRFSKTYTRSSVGRASIGSWWTSIPKVAGSIPTVVRQTFQPARCGCTLRVTLQASFSPEYITPTHT